MGYDTQFEGRFELNKPLDDNMYIFLDLLSTTRRMKRKVDAVYGIEGEFYVEGSGSFGQDREDNIVYYNKPPSTQPGLWCQWRPSKDRMAIEWDEGEKFYNYKEWLVYLIHKVLAPSGYVLNGKVRWVGERSGDSGNIIVKDNLVYCKHSWEVEDQLVEYKLFDQVMFAFEQKLLF